MENILFYTGWRQRKKTSFRVVCRICLCAVCLKSPACRAVKWSPAAGVWWKRDPLRCRVFICASLTSIQSCRMGICVFPGTGKAETQLTFLGLYYYDSQAHVVTIRFWNFWNSLLCRHDYKCTLVLKYLQWTPVMWCYNLAQEVCWLFALPTMYITNVRNT